MKGEKTFAVCVWRRLLPVCLGRLLYAKGAANKGRDRRVSGGSTGEMFFCTFVSGLPYLWFLLY